MRTNIDIDDALMAEAIEIGGFATKKAAVETALREWVLDAKRRKALDELWGAMPDWEGDLNAMRRGDKPERGFHEDGEQ